MPAYCLMEKKDMATRRDRTNQFGYVCPTENQAIWNADHSPKQSSKRKTRVLPENQIRNQGVQKTDAAKQLESLSAYVEQMDGKENGTKEEQKLKKLRNIYAIIINICSLAGVRLNGIQLHYTGDSTVYTKKELQS